MSKSVKIDISVPYFVCKFECSYCEIERPSGMQYLFLTIVGSEFTKYMTWKDALSEFGIPEDIFIRIIAPMAYEMKDLVKIDGVLSVDGKVSDVELTDKGRTVLGEKIIAEKEETAKGQIVYIPALLDDKKFSYGTEQLKNLLLVSNPEEGIGHLFEDIDIDSTDFDLEIENTIRKNKNKIGIDEESDIIKTDVKERIRDLYFWKKIELSFDEITGTYSLKSSALDNNFIKSYYNAEYILSKISDSEFSINPKFVNPGENWRKELPSEETYNLYLPAHPPALKPDGMMINENLDNPSGMFTFTGDCDLIDVNSKHCYYFVEKQAMISGVEGTYPGRFIMEAPIDAEKCFAIVKESFEKVQIKNVESFRKAIRIIEPSCDEEYLSKFIRNYLLSNDDFIRSINQLKDYKEKKWYDRTIGSTIADKAKTVEKLEELLSKIKEITNVDYIAERMGSFEGIDKIMMADVLMSHSSPKRAPIYAVRLSDDYCRIILGDLHYGTEPKSIVMNSIINASNNLAQLKEALNIKSLSDYSFDLSELVKSNLNLSRFINTFLTETEKIGPYIKNSNRYQDIDRYRTFFTEIRPMFDKSYKDSIRLFGVNNGIKMESALARISEGDNTAEKLIFARDNKIITESDYILLDEFRSFRNKCAHELITTNPDEKKKKRWADAIEHLEMMLSDEG